MDERDDIGKKDVRPPEKRGSAPQGLDRDILVDRIAAFVGGVVALLAVTGVVSWLLYRGFRDEMTRRDPPPPPLLEARARVIPPEPRLQIKPALDMDAYRAREQAVLTSYGWADQQAATVRIPIDRAIDLYVTGGLRAAVIEQPADAMLDGGAPDSGVPGLPDGGATDGASDPRFFEGARAGSGPADMGLLPGSVLSPTPLDGGAADAGPAPIPVDAGPGPVPVDGGAR